MAKPRLKSHGLLKPREAGETPISKGVLYKIFEEYLRLFYMGIPALPRPEDAVHFNFHFMLTFRSNAGLTLHIFVQCRFSRTNVGSSLIL